MLNTDRSTTGAGILLQRLKVHGIDRIFGIVGREADSILFDEEPGIGFTLTRHEMNAGLICCGLARYTGKPQVCFATIGPGSTNLITAIATAALDRYPVLAIAAQVETFERHYNQAHQCVNGAAIFAPLVKYCKEIDSVDEIPGSVDEAVEQMVSGQKGPAFLSVPVDVLRAKGTRCSRPKGDPRPSLGQLNGDSLGSAIRAINEANQPMLVLGDAAARDISPEKFRKVAERLNIPVVSTYSGKGVLPHGHRLYYGAITPHLDAILRHKALDEIFGPTDCLVLIGYDLAEHLMPKVWERGRPKTIVRACSHPNPTPELVRPDIDLVGPIDQLLEVFMNQVKPRAQTHDISLTRKRIAALENCTKLPDEGFYPEQVLSRLNTILGEYVLVNDVGQHRHASAIFYRAPRPGDFFTSAGLSSFGTALGFAIGAKLAVKDRTVVLIAGDAGFQSTMGDLETLKRLNQKILIVIYQNNKSALIERYQTVGRGRINKDLLYFGDVDYVGLAEAHGIPGCRTRSIEELSIAIENFRSGQTAMLIELPISYPNNYVNEFLRNYHVES